MRVKIQHVAVRKLCASVQDDCRVIDPCHNVTSYLGTYAEEEIVLAI